MTLDEIKAAKKELSLTNEMISNLSGVPLSTVEKIFSGATKKPRKLTMLTIEAMMIELAKKTGTRSYDLSGETETYMIREPIAAYGSAVKFEEEKHTLEDYYALPDERRVEMIDGVFYDMSSPSAEHQIILGDLYLLFRECADRHGMPCRVMLSPFDILLNRDEPTMVEPDLMVFCKDTNMHNLKRYEGAPDLVVEILSPSTRSKDLILKLYKYQKEGVREYWIVDPKYRTVTVHYFEDEENYAPREYSFDSVIPVIISEGKCEINFSKVGV